MFGTRKNRRRPVPEPPEKRDARAYVLLEEARLRCEALRGEAKTRARHDALNCVQRELGRAGLFASSNLPTSVRHPLLADAHHRSTETPAGASDAIDALVMLIRCSNDAVEHGLVAPGLSDHMHFARVHLLRAEELLEERLVVEASIWLENSYVFREPLRGQANGL